MTRPQRTVDKLKNSHSKGHKGIYLINQVGFSGSLEESKRDVTYRNDPTIEGVSQSANQTLKAIGASLTEVRRRRKEREEEKKRKGSWLRIYSEIFFFHFGICTRLSKQTRKRLLQVFSSLKRAKC
ncbi:unnamed protein product [Kuraishia capsulata CBS 1993]|uniref:Uncharacterized protein n=1 Tax=Kuraishia capsulata CBS 1993 TaxID=1382522 RepID=W6MJ31_9ASCO|nr:uncharacterized protein KUCA_T00002197001 [Kuraishia capsulata CBS 1993]CDK26226.1 unnamed protein product [Kuraishia capsulata CBS 1993]